MRKWHVVVSFLSLSTFSVLFLLFQNAASARDCSEAEMADMLAEPTGKNWSYRLNCNPHFRSTDVVTKTLIVIGSKSDLEIACTHNQTTDVRTTFRRDKSIGEKITVNAIPAMVESAANSRDAADPSDAQLAINLTKLETLISDDRENLEFVKATIESRKNDLTLSYKEFHDMRKTEGKLTIKLSILNAYKKELKRLGSAVKSEKIYYQARGVLTFDTNKSGPGTRIKKLVDQALSNRYITDNTLRIIEMRISKYSHRILVMSDTPDGGKTWIAPDNISIKNCRIEGLIRVLGMAPNGDDAWYGGKEFKASSKLSGHTKRAQDAAPTKISFENMWVKDGKVYFAPGVTHSNFSSSTLVDSTIYLDTESANNVIDHNTFYSVESTAVNKGEREFVSIDGSKDNDITDNNFGTPNHPLERGGVFLYRNCGEGGVTRHQTSHNNLIEGNKFQYENNNTIKIPAISVNSRYGKDQYYCKYDNGNEFGSSKVNNKEFIKGIKIINNATYNWNTKNGEPLKVNSLEENGITKITAH